MSLQQLQVRIRCICVRNRGHFRDEKKVYELLIRVFRSPELIVKLTEMHPGWRSVRKILNREEE